MISLDSAVLDSGRLRKAFACFPTGVAAVCSLVDGEPVGMAVSSFAPVSLSPPLVSVCVQKTSETWPKLRCGPRLGLSVLAGHQEAACCALSSKTGDRFAESTWETNEYGAVFVLDAVGWFDCTVYTEIEAGDHIIVLVEIHRLWTDYDSDPLVFHGSRYRRLAASPEAADAT
ncbi:flavin reductase family protein [Mycobacterium sp.]|uniref:flavin reductase family protein n=1 Tax=Mycobacterium sp. TaxID=1785 RepID=UPI003C76D083